MSKITLIFSLVLKLIAIILTVMFSIQLYEAITEDNRFLFFQIILIFVWGVGALLFWILGIVLGKSYKAGKNKQEIN